MLASFCLAVGLLQTHVKDLVVTDQPTTPLHLAVGQKLVFSVYENASTGASWTIKEPGKPGLKFLDISSDEPKSGSPPKPGEGATIRIRFQAVKKGTYSIKLIYGRSWELAKGQKPWDSRSAKVVIQ
ncbi:MAG TPA: protease inhibitor I42 family protein [Fimbriimonadaceae bacterium]|nr:protease inhibitor I42 family protein [Fimbriimonadaceae bacterium]